MMDTKKLAARVSPHFMFAGDVKKCPGYSWALQLSNLFVSHFVNFVDVNFIFLIASVGK